MDKTKNLNVGDIVRIIDGSYAERLDEYEENSCLGLCKDNFKVISIRNLHKIKSACNIYDYSIHDIHIQNISTGAIYLHSSAFVTVVKSKAKELYEIDEKIKALKKERIAILINKIFSDC